MYIKYDKTQREHTQKKMRKIKNEKKKKIKITPNHETNDNTKYE